MFLDVPFRHEGRDARDALDCAGFIVAILRELKVPFKDAPGYSRNPNGTLLNIIGRSLERIDVNTASPGDVVVMWFDPHTKEPQHLALLTEKGIIHSWMRVGKVAETAFQPLWRKRVVAAYRIPGVV